MTPPRSFVGFLASPRTINPWVRRGVFATLVLICAVLTFFPERYRAAATLAPSDPAALGLSGALVQLGAVNSVFGNQASVEIAMRIANSVGVRDELIKKLNLVEKLGLENTIQANRYLERKVDVRSMRGGILQIEMLDRDPELSRAIVTEVANQTRARLAVINRNQTAYKRQVLEELITSSHDRLTRAQTAYDNFRLRTRYSDPVVAIAAIGDRIPTLQAAVKAKEVQLSAARRFYTEDNQVVRQLAAEREALLGQLAEARALSPSSANSVGRVVRESTQGEQLERELSIAKSLYENYTLFLQGTSVEDLTSTANVRILEPPYVDPQRQYNLIPLLTGIALLLIGLAVEFYSVRPPVLARTDT